MNNRKPFSGPKIKIWMSIPPWLMIGAMAILTPIFIYMTRENIQRQKEHTVQVFREKGDALIRSFEAGVRSGIRGGEWDFFALQKLLMETAQQPDIDYLIVADDQGTILADSDPAMIGERYGTELDLRRISRSRRIEWRQVQNDEGEDTFEVFRGFSPADREIGDLRRGAPRRTPPDIGGQEDSRDRQVIFVGLNMGPIEAVRKQTTRHAIVMAVVLLFIGFSGIVLLFFVQEYRSVRSSLTRMKAFSDSLVENMPIGLTAINSEGDIISLNQAGEAILQRKAHEVVGTKARDILPPELTEVIGMLQAEKRIIERELTCTGAQGRIFRLEVIATMLKDDDGAFLGYVLLFRDMTEVQRLKREVARSQRLASLGSLAAGVAHEIRNPLSSIKGFATYFKERYREHPEDGKTADIMVQEVDRLNRVIGQLLELARPVVIARKPSSLPLVLQHALKMIEQEARDKNIAIRTEIPAEVPAIMMDGDKMKQVLLNLFLNALEAMPQGGALSVALMRNDARTVRLTVTDTGTGINPQDLAHIFDPYFTTKPSGTGLGLSIVQKIIEAHDGEIHATSTPGTGTAVSMILPLQRETGGVQS